jgi:hypothetical protein
MDDAERHARAVREQDLRIAVMEQDVKLKTRQAFWETPKGFAAIIAALAVVIGTIGGLVGYQIGQRDSRPIHVIVDSPAPR